MSTSPRTTKEPEQTTKPRSTVSAPMLMLLTALDTTLRLFIPTIGGTFLGIGIDHLLNIAPIATIVCLILGVATSALLITIQLRTIRKQS